MKQVSDIIRKFFEDYEKGVNAPDNELLASRYGDSFMFASPQGAQSVKKDDFLKALPKRQEFFKAVGLKSSKIQSLEETRLGDNDVLIKAYWIMRFEKEPGRPIEDKTSATYILHQQEHSLRIVCQIDHQDLMKRAQDLGLLPAKQ
jgi:ketosteroid isomerase-like protein